MHKCKEKDIRCKMCSHWHGQEELPITENCKTTKPTEYCSLFKRKKGKK